MPKQQLRHSIYHFLFFAGLLLIAEYVSDRLRKNAHQVETMEDGWFILDNMNRPYPELSIRNGVTNEEKVYVGDTEYDLASLMPLGKELHLYVAPLYQVLYKKKEIRS